MIKGVVTNGVVVPRDPFPADWEDGMEVTVEKSPHNDEAEKDSKLADDWMNEVAMLAGQGDSADDRRLEAAIEEARLRGKKLARERLGLDP